MPKESVVVVCPNPRCHRKFEEPILLNNLSATPVEQYPACPHCFFKLDVKAERDEDMAQTSTADQAMHPALEKVRDAISTQPREEPKEPKEPKKSEEPKKEEPSEKEGKRPPGCAKHLGFLASRDKSAPIPQECLTCQEIVDCMLGSGARR